MQIFPKNCYECAESFVTLHANNKGNGEKGNSQDTQRRRGGTHRLQLQLPRPRDCRDRGITIAGSFQQAGLYQDEIDGSETEALKLANEGYSTKNRPEAENRGYGISTSKEMLVVGMKGAFFMLSGGAFHRYENGANDYIDLRNLFRWQGTVVLMRIPVVLPDGFNYIDYLE